MAKGRFKVNREGFRQLRTSQEVTDKLLSIAENAAANANASMGPPAPTDKLGYYANARTNPKNRAAAYVRTGGFTSRRDNRKNNTLLKSVNNMAGWV